MPKCRVKAKRRVGGSTSGSLGRPVPAITVTWSEPKVYFVDPAELQLDKPGFARPAGEAVRLPTGRAS